MRKENTYTVEKLFLGEAKGLVIEQITIKDNLLRIVGCDFTANILDETSCCEARYMKCDDDLNYFIGSTLQDIEYAENVAQDDDNQWGSVTDYGWLKIVTSSGVFTVNTYNENNGYYSGLCLTLSVFESAN